MIINHRTRPKSLRGAKSDRAKLVAFALAGLWQLAFHPGWAIADIIQLKNGEEFEAQILLEKPDRLWVRTHAGARWVAVGDIAQRVPAPSPWERYEQTKKKFPMTAVGQYELAMWCAANKLDKEREQHLRLSVGLDPQYEPACLALGYTKVGDKWEPPRKETLNVPKPAGKTGKAPPIEKAAPEPTIGPEAPPARPDGPEPEELVKRRRAWSFHLSDITQRFLSSQDERTFAVGRDKLLAITDPLALDGIIDNLGNRREPHLRLLMVRAMGNLKRDRDRDYNRMVLQLLATALSDTNNQVSGLASQELARLSDQRVTLVLREGLRSGPDDLLDRCALLLGALRDMDSVPLLVEVLVGRPRHTSEWDPGGVVRFWRTARRTIGEYTVALEPEPLIFNDKVQAALAGRVSGTGRRPELPFGNKGRADVMEALVRIADGKANHGLVGAAWMDWYREQLKERERTARPSVPVPTPAAP